MYDWEGRKRRERGPPRWSIERNPNGPNANMNGTSLNLRSHGRSPNIVQCILFYQTPTLQHRTVSDHGTPTPSARALAAAAFRGNRILPYHITRPCQTLAYTLNLANGVRRSARLDLDQHKSQMKRKGEEEKKERERASVASLLFLVC